MAEQRTLDAEREFEAWWESDGQYIRAGGGQYEKSFAYAAWLAARRAPPALDTEGLPPLIWGDDLEAWLEVRDEAEIVAAIRAAQRHAYDAGQQSQAARIQHLTHERDLALAAARQSAPEGAPVAWAVTAPKGGIHKLSITRDSAERKAARWREEWPDNACRVRPLVFGDAAPMSASAQPKGENNG